MSKPVRGGAPSSTETIISRPDETGIIAKENDSGLDADGGTEIITRGDGGSTGIGFARHITFAAPKL